MEHVQLAPTPSPLTGTVKVPGDKSISHRAIIFASLAQGRTTISHFLDGEDCMRTIAAFQAMGVRITKDKHNVTVDSGGVASLKEPHNPIDLGNSGTTARLLMGILAGLPFHTTLFGDASLTLRPMDRITNPLREMGANIDGRVDGKFLPIAVRGSRLKAISFKPPVKSAQVKSGVLLAGLLADGTTEVIEETKTRDHTEKMFQAFGGDIRIKGNKVSLKGKQTLKGTTIQVPGDISSAAFFLVAAAVVPGSRITITDVGLNETRTGILDVLKKMNVNIKIKEEKYIGGESIGSITVESSDVWGTKIDGDIIPRMIDEIPIVALLATQAKGTTIIRDAKELRYKETDRIATVVNTLNKLGADIEATADGMVINGPTPIQGGIASSEGDHRIGMMAAIASLIAKSDVILKQPDSINISYPSFFSDLEQLKG